MKKLILVVAVMSTLAGFSQKQPAKPAATLSPVKLATAADTMQYTLGAFMGLWINSNGFVITNPSLFIRGIDDIFQNRPRVFPDSVIGQRIAAYQETAQKGRALQQEQQLFASLKDKPGVGMFPNGVRYIILKTGKGDRPAETDSILVNLIAKLAEGTVVEDTYQTKRPFATRPAGFFAGLNEALQMMTAGSRWQLFVPSVLAYGDKGTTLIPPNSALVIEVELLEVKSQKK